MNIATLGLIVLLVGGVIYLIGVDRTRSAASSTASATKRAATSGITIAGAGAAGGIAAGDAVWQFIATDPATVLAGIVGALGTLGLEGIIDITPAQFGLLAGVLIIGYAAWRKR